MMGNLCSFYYCLFVFLAGSLQICFNGSAEMFLSCTDLNGI